MRVHDLTHDLTFDPYENSKKGKSGTVIRSNASIARVGKNTYVMVYRMFVPKDSDKRTATPMQWRFAWRGKWSGTIYCMLKRDRQTGALRVLKNSEKVVRIGKARASAGEDMRVFRISGDDKHGKLDGNLKQKQLGLSYNVWPSGADVLKHAGKGMRDDIRESCAVDEPEGCTFIAYSPAKLVHEESGRFKLDVSKKVYPCLNVDKDLPVPWKRIMAKGNRCFEGQREEKNWVWWEYDNGEEKRMMLSYFLYPHVVLSQNDDGRCSALPASPHSIDFFAEIQKKYKTLRFLLGTPPIKFRKEGAKKAEEYLAVGHAKYDFKKAEASGTPILSNETLSGKRLHYDVACGDAPSHLIYFMFLYTFDANPPFAVRRISKCFIPPTDSGYLLPFPMGVANAANDTLFISYGEGDSKVKVLEMTRLEIDQMLLNVNYLDANDYPFDVM